MLHARPSLTSTPPLSCVTRTDWERATIMPRGSLDSTTAASLETEVLRLCAAGFSAIVIDLRALHFTEPAGSLLLRRLHEMADRHHVTLSFSDAAAAM